MINRKLIASVCIASIIVMSVFIWLNKDEYFKSEVTVTYPDGCIERYVNAELVTPICEEGRRLTDRPEPEFNPVIFPDYGGSNWTNNKSKN